MATSPAVSEWLNWVLTTSVPLMRTDETGRVIAQATGTLVEFQNRLFVISVAHAVPKETSGWALEIGLDPTHGTEVFHINAFAYAAEFTRSTASFRELDLCFAEIAKDLEPRYEFRTPRGLFDRRPRHIFKVGDISEPNSQSTFAFSGRVRHERHGEEVFVSDMAVYPGLKYLASSQERHEFSLPVPHPGHDAFHGCSGSPVVDIERRIVGLLTSGVEATNTVVGIAIQRCIPGLRFLCEARNET